MLSWVKLLSPFSRSLRAARYQADENLASKDAALDIDKTCRELDVPQKQMFDTQRIRQMTEQYV